MKRNNADIAEHGRVTRFGQPGGPDPSVAGRIGAEIWPVRKAVRLLAGMRVKSADKITFEDLIGDNPTIAQVIAARLFEAAFAGNIRALRRITDLVDGKLPKVNVNAEWDRLRGMSDEQLVNELNQRIVNFFIVSSP